MSWNDGYYDKNGNSLSSNDGDQEVFDKDGNSVGYFEGSTIYDNNDNRLKGMHDDDPPSSSRSRGFFGIW